MRGVSVHRASCQVWTGGPRSGSILRVNPLRTSFESPWQNGVAERWVGSCRRDLLDHIIAVDEGHLKRRLSEYIRYYHEDHTQIDAPTRV